MTDRSLEIKLSIKDQEVIKRALASMGKDGEAALKKLSAAAKPVATDLKLIDAAAKETRSELEGLAARAGIGGNILRSVGPGALVAAAGLGVLTVGFGKAVEAAGRTIRAFSDLQDAADRLDLNVETLQALRFAGSQVGVEFEKTDAALSKLSTTLGSIARGEGAAGEKALAQLGLSAFDAQGKLLTVEQLLPKIADKLALVTDQQTRLSLAQDLFGKSGAQFVQLLRDGSDALEEQMQAARDLGAVVDAELVKKGAEASNKLQSMWQIIDTQINSALVDLAPLLVNVASALADIAKALREVYEAWKSAGPVVQALADVALGARSLSNLNKGLAGKAVEFRAREQGAGPDGGPGEVQSVNSMAKGDRLPTKTPERVRTQRDPFGDTLKNLIFETEQLRLNSREQFINAQLRRAGVKADSDRGQQIAKLAGLLFDERVAEKQLAQAKAEGKSLTEEMRNPEEERIARIARLNELLRAGAIDHETYNRAVAAADDKALSKRTDFGAGIQRGLKELQKDTADFASVAQDMVVGAFDSMEDKFVEFVRTGKISFADLIDSMIADLARLAYRAAMSGLLNFAAGAIGGALGGGAPVGSGESIAIGGLYAKGGVFDRGRVKKFAAGGVIDRATLFNIGMMGEAGPEAIMPLVRGPGGRLGVSAMGGGASNLQFAPVTNIDARGSNITEWQIQALLDQRDRQWMENLPDLIKEARVRAQI